MRKKRKNSNVERNENNNNNNNYKAKKQKKNNKTTTTPKQWMKYILSLWRRSLGIWIKRCSLYGQYSNESLTEIKSNFLVAFQIPLFEHFPHYFKIMLYRCCLNLLKQFHVVRTLNSGHVPIKWTQCIAQAKGSCRVVCVFIYSTEGWESRFGSYQFLLIIVSGHAHWGSPCLWYETLSGYCWQCSSFEHPPPSSRHCKTESKTINTSTFL